MARQVVWSYEAFTDREIFVREMRLIYAIEQSRIAVLGLIHGRRDLKKLWKGR